MSRRSRSCCSRWARRGAAAAAVLALLSGCAVRREADTLRVGLALYQQEDTFISGVVQEMERLAREEESRSDLKINLSIADGDSSQALQLDQIERFLDGGCHVLCVNIVDRTEASLVIDYAREAGVPVVFFNRQPVEEDLRRWEQVYYVGPKGEQSGIYQGEIVLEAMARNPERVDRSGDGVLQYVMLEGEPGHQDALLRTEYSIRTITQAGVAVEQLASASANWSRGQAAARMEPWWQEFGSEIEVIFANNDDMALGAIDVLTQAGVEPEDMPLVVGVDGTPDAIAAMEAGTLAGTVQNAQEMPQVLMDLVMALYRGESADTVAQVDDEHYIWLPYRKILPNQIP